MYKKLNVVWIIAIIPLFAIFTACGDKNSHDHNCIWLKTTLTSTTRDLINNDDLVANSRNTQAVKIAMRQQNRANKLESWVS